MTPEPVLRVLVAEGQPATRIGLRALLTGAGLQVVGATASCAEAVVIARDTRTDVALIDLALGDAPDLTALTRLAAAAPTLPLVAFTTELGGERVRAVLAAGASGIVTKSAPPERIIAALRAAANGLTAVPRVSPPAGPLIAPAQTDAAAAPTANPAVRAPSVLEPLTARELDLLRYLALGHTNKEIARAMVLAEDTVKKAVQTVIAKLNATDRTNAVVVALRNALID